MAIDNAFVTNVAVCELSIDQPTLAPPTAATTIKGGGTVTDGPFVETKEALNGIYVVEARDLDHAVEIAKLCPAPAPGGGVEVRPVVDPTTNPF